MKWRATSGPQALSLTRVLKHSDFIIFHAFFSYYFEKWWPNTPVTGFISNFNCSMTTDRNGLPVVPCGIALLAVQKLSCLSMYSLPTVLTLDSGWCPPLCALWFAADHSRGCWREKSLLPERAPCPANTGSPCSSSRWPLHTHTQDESGTCKWAKFGVIPYLFSD